MRRRRALVIAAIFGGAAGCTALAGLDAHERATESDTSFDAAGDAPSTSDAASDASSDAVVSVDADGASGGDASLAPAPTDVLFFTGETVRTNAFGRVTTWDNGNPEFASLSAFATVPSSAPGLLQLANGETCVVFTGEAPLKIAATTALNFDVDDFSATVVVRRAQTITSEDHGRIVISRNTLANGTTLNPQYDYRGFALMTEYQDDQRIGSSKALKYAARMSLTLNSVGSFEVVDPDPRLDSRDVVTMYRRGDELWLRVNETLKFPASGRKLDARNYNITGGGFFIGQSDDEADTATRFNGQVCAIIVHRGPETDAVLTARIAALRAKYPFK